MMRRAYPFLLVLLFTLAAFHTVAAAQEGTADDFGDDSGDDSGDPALLVRYAILGGDQPSRSTAPVGDLLDWDYQRDNEELKRLFGLETIHTLQLGTARLAPSGGRFSATAEFESSLLEVKVRMIPGRIEGLEENGAPTELAEFRFEVLRDGEVLTAPKIITHYGQRAIVTSSVGAVGSDEGTEKTPVIWIVTQVDRLP